MAPVPFFKKHFTFQTTDNVFKTRI